MFFEVDIDVEQGDCMILFICLFFPSLISLKRELSFGLISRDDYLSMILVFAKWVIINMFCSFLILFMFSDKKGSTVFDGSATISFVIQYLAVSVTFSFLLPNIYHFLKEHIKFELKARRKGFDE